MMIEGLRHHEFADIKGFDDVDDAYAAMITAKRYVKEHFSTEDLAINVDVKERLDDVVICVSVGYFSRERTKDNAVRVAEMVYDIVEEIKNYVLKISG